MVRSYSRMMGQVALEQNTGKPRCDALDDCLRLFLVRIIAVGMQERDDDAFGPDLPRLRERVLDGALVQLLFHRSIGQDPPWDAVYEVARDQRLGALGEKVVHVRDLEAGDLEHVAKMLSREQR